MREGLGDRHPEQVEHPMEVLMDFDQGFSRTNPDRPRQFNGAGEEVDYFISIVCTDRGQHERVQLTEARRMLDGQRGMNHALKWFAPPQRDAEPHTFLGRDSYVFRCPKCPRTPQVQRDKWWSLLDGAVKADFDELESLF